MPHRRGLAALLAAPALLRARPSHAQGWALARPVRLVVPFGLGGSADVAARFLAEPLAQALGQPFIVENRPGAGATIGTDQVAKSAADGHTLLLMSNTHTANETLLPGRPYVLLRDLAPVAAINVAFHALVVHPSLAARTLPELIALLRANPGRFDYASSGPGTPYHIAGEVFRSMAGVEVQHVPFRGSNEARTAVISGQVPIMFDAIPTMREQIVGGRVRGLATTGPERSPLLPELPVVADTLPGYEASIWLGLMAPAGTPRADLAKVLRLPAEHITVEHREGAGCYGHNGADDVALDAALAARPTPGVWVRALWSRAEELAWSPQTPAMRVDVEAALGADGTIASWCSHVRSNGHTGRPGRGALATLLAAEHVAGGARLPPSINPPLQGGGGAQRNQVPLYAIPHLEARLTTLSDMPIRSSALRGLGALLYVLAIESVMDEFSDNDPVGFRLRHLAHDRRAAEVLRACAEMSGFDGRGALPEGEGMGIALARYKNSGAWCVVAARVRAEERVRCTHLWLAADCGEAINPDGALNQLEGGAIHGVSVALFERTTTDGQRITSDAWESYPVLRFRDVPHVESRLIVRPAEPPLGAGEASMGPAIAAIAGGIRQALGIAPTRLPFTPENLAREAAPA